MLAARLSYRRGLLGVDRAKQKPELIGEVVINIFVFASRRAVDLLLKKFANIIRQLDWLALLLDGWRRVPVRMPIPFLA